MNTFTDLHAKLLTQPHGRAGSTHRVLIVSDDTDSVGQLQRLVDAAGRPEIRVARRAGTALAIALDFQPTIILLDLELPDLSGYAVARLLGRHPRLQGARLIALTGRGDHPRRELARRAGFERYLLKPVAESALEELLAVMS